jgi:hypothetical protein
MSWKCDRVWLLLQGHRDGCVLHIKHSSLLFSKECLKMAVDYDNLKKGKNVHKLHDYSYSENTDNANCACKPCKKPILYQILE